MHKQTRRPWYLHTCTYARLYHTFIRLQRASLTSCEVKSVPTSAQFLRQGNFAQHRQRREREELGRGHREVTRRGTWEPAFRSRAKPKHGSDKHRSGTAADEGRTGASQRTAVAKAGCPLTAPGRTSALTSTVAMETSKSRTDARNVLKGKGGRGPRR